MLRKEHFEHIGAQIECEEEEKVKGISDLTNVPRYMAHIPSMPTYF
jgi:hypothetical protein